VIDMDVPFDASVDVTDARCGDLARCAAPLELMFIPHQAVMLNI
jgi:hypothetical protein